MLTSSCLELKHPVLCHKTPYIRTEKEHNCQDSSTQCLLFLFSYVFTEIEFITFLSLDTSSCSSRSFFHVPATLISSWQYLFSLFFMCVCAYVCMYVNTHTHTYVLPVVKISVIIFVWGWNLQTSFSCILISSLMLALFWSPLCSHSLERVFHSRYWCCDSYNHYIPFFGHVPWVKHYKAMV